MPGAVDYIVKPFSPSELTSQARAALRRIAGPRPFVQAELTIRYDQRHGTVAGRSVQLTATEYELLRVLSVNAGRVLTRESLLSQTWRRGDRRPPDPKFVRTVVKLLRRKLGDDAADPAYIRNERGIGYSHARRLFLKVLKEPTEAAPVARFRTQPHWS